MINFLNTAIGRIATDSRKALMLAAALALTVGLWAVSESNHQVQADGGDFAAAIETKLTASDGAAFDLFGRSVSVSGDTAVVGAYLDDDGGLNSGSVYVFVRSGGVWTEQAKLTASDAAAGDQFGRPVSVSGDTVVVGVYADDDAGLNSGSAYVFVRSGGVWTEQAKLTASDAAAGDQFGYSVSVSVDTAVVGAVADDHAGFYSGSTYVFARSGGVWAEQAKLTASDAAELDHFGFRLSVDGDTAVVGAVGDADGGLDSGSAYVFTRSGVTWTEEAKLTASDAAAGDWFGWSVSLSGDTAVVGAANDADGGLDSGSAYVFVGSGSSWTEQAKLTASDAAAYDWFGFQLSVSGDTVVVGAYGDDDAGDYSGSAYVFTRSGSSWTEQTKLTASDAAAGDYFGMSVSVSGNTVVVGAVLDDDAGSNSGSVYVFEALALEQCDCAKSVGFWKKQFSGKAKKDQFSDSTLEAYLDIVDAGSAFFGSMTIAQANDVFNPPKSNNGGTGSGSGSSSGSNEATNPSSNGKKKKHGSKDGDSKSGTGANLTKKQQNAEKQILAAWLNFAAGGVTGDEVIDTPEGPMTFDALMGTVEGLLSGAPTADELERAKDLAESVNKHDQDNPDCDTGTGSSSNSGTGTGSRTGSKTR
jgi:hypothetical protein